MRTVLGRLRVVVGGLMTALMGSGLIGLAALPYPSVCEQCRNYAPAWACIGLCGW